MRKKASQIKPKQTSPEFERFRDFAKKIVNVPKKEIDEQVKKQAKEKTKQN